MRRIINSTYISLDGVVEGPHPEWNNTTVIADDGLLDELRPWFHPLLVGGIVSLSYEVTR